MTAPIDSSDLPVESVDDVAAVWSSDLYDPTQSQPILAAVQCGQTAMLKEYQRDAEYAQEQSDPLTANAEYLDEIGSFEFGIHRQPTEIGEVGDASYRSRLFHQSTVAPETLIAAANAVFAPFTDISCVYFEHSDALYVRDDAFDLVGASNTGPITVTTRYALPPYLPSSVVMQIADVAGNTAANGDWLVSFTLDPLAADVQSTSYVTKLSSSYTAGSGILSVTGSPGTPGPGSFLQVDDNILLVTAAAPTGLSFSVVGAQFGTTDANAGAGTGVRFYAAPPPAVTLSGTPLTSSWIVLTITAAGEAGAATFTYETASGVFGPLVVEPTVSLVGTGLTATFTAGSAVYEAGMVYRAGCRAFALTGSTGNGTYGGGGSATALASDGTDSIPWSAHAWGATYSTQNYPDRRYDALPHRFSGGARCFSDVHDGRLFWVLAPDLSGVDSNVAALLSNYLDIVDVTSTAPIEVTTRYALPPEVVTGATVTVVAVFESDGVTPNPGIVGSWIVTVTGENTFTLNGSTAPSIAYLGGGSVQTSNTIGVNTDAGFFVDDGIELTGELVIVHGTTGTLDATHELGLMRSSTGETIAHLHASPSSGENAGVRDADGLCGPGAAILVGGNGHSLEDPTAPGNFATAIVLATPGAGATWQFDVTDGLWHLAPPTSAFVWSIATTSFDLYSAACSAVDALKGQSIRWGFLVDPKLGIT